MFFIQHIQRRTRARRQPRHDERRRVASNKAREEMNDTRADVPVEPCCWRSRSIDISGFMPLHIIDTPFAAILFIIITHIFLHAKSEDI